MAAWWVLSTQPVHEVWMLPAWEHAFDKKLLDFEDRLRMCEMATMGIKGISVRDYERDLAGDILSGKTVRTLEYLTNKFPLCAFSLVVGADILEETHRWYRWDRIQELAKLIVVGRHGYGDPSLPAPPHASSTEIREALDQRDRAKLSRLLPSAVLKYIDAKGLYTCPLTNVG